MVLEWELTYVSCLLKFYQVSALKVTGVSHLFMVPQVRTSQYTSLFSEAYPALRESAPGNIQEPALPDLRNLVVINNMANSIKYQQDLHGLRSAFDWRDILAWQEDPAETQALAKIEDTLDKDDVTNLIFTRLFFLSNV